jgi:DNA-binding CsgD family transcriptional regulator
VALGDLTAGLWRLVLRRQRDRRRRRVMRGDRLARPPRARYLESMSRVTATRADIAALAHVAEDGPSFDRALLVGLQRDIGFDVAFLQSKDAGRPPLVLGLDAAPFAAAPSERLGAYDRELAPVRRAALAARGVAVDTEVLGSAGVRACAYHRDLAAPVGGKHSLVAYVRLRGRELAALVLGRTGRRFRSGEVARVEALLPTLAIALASLPRATYAAATPAALTPRERDVLSYVCLGYTNREIARACGTSANTVRNQLARVFAKLGASTRAEAVGLSLGAVTPGDAKRT